MITDAILTMFVNIISAIVSIFPVETTLPFGTDSIVATAIGGFKAFMNIFPPMALIFTVTMIYLGFLGTLKLWSVVPFFGKMVSKK